MYNSRFSPPNNKSYISPYTQRILLNNADYYPKVFLSSVINNFLQSFSLGFDEKIYDFDSQCILCDGTFIDSNEIVKKSYDDRLDCILDGLKTTFSFDSTSVVDETYFVVDIDPGMAVVDSTLLVFPQTTQLGLPLTSYGDTDACGNIVLSINYAFIDSLETNNPYLSLDYQDFSVSDSLSPNGWNVARNRLVLNVFTWNRTESEIDTESFESLVPNPYDFSMLNLFIRIGSVDYQIGPVHACFYQYKHAINELYTKNITVNISPDEWVEDITSFDGTTRLYKVIDISYLNVSNYPCVECFVDDMIISPYTIEVRLETKEICIWMPLAFSTEGKDLIVSIIG